MNVFNAKLFKNLRKDYGEKGAFVAAYILFEVRDRDGMEYNIDELSDLTDSSKSVCKNVVGDLVESGWLTIKEGSLSITRELTNRLKTPKQKKPSLTPEQNRKLLMKRFYKFRDEVISIADKQGYDKEEAKNFYNHWGASSTPFKEMRWEREQRLKGAFVIKLRLGTWFRNKKNWNKPNIEDPEENRQKTVW